MDVRELIEQIKQRNRRALGKAITIVEDGDPGKEELLNYAYKNMKDDAFIIGITGPGGAGKSTLIDKLIGAYRAKGKTVGVIAVDPSSPFTGGAVLGDRVRMGTHAMDKEVFIRSLGSRGAIGGISTGTKNVLYLYKTFGFDIIIVESLGVGQDETEITNFVDITVVTLVPGFGDEIQLSKAGIQEIGDVFIINKSDKPDADAVFNQLSNAFSVLPDEKRPFIVNTVASDNIGIDKALEAFAAAAVRQLPNREAKAHRRVKNEIETEISVLIDDKVQALVESMSEEILSSKATPFEVSRLIMGKIKFNL